MTNPISPDDLPSFINMLNALPLPIAIYRRDGLLVAMNTASEVLWGVSSEQLVGSFNVLTDSRRRGESPERFLSELETGKTHTLDPVAYDSSMLTFEMGRQGKIWIQTTLLPVRGQASAFDYIGIIRRDVTDVVEQQQHIEEAQQKLSDQQQVIEQLSMPVVQVWDGILLVPLVGTIDARRSAAITETLLTTIGERQAEITIIDITGVPVVDTYVAQYLIATTRAAQLLGCQTALVGIRTEIAQSLVQLGVELGNLKTLANLQMALQWALEQLGLRIVERKNRT